MTRQSYGPTRVPHFDSGLLIDRVRWVLEQTGEWTSTNDLYRAFSKGRLKGKDLHAALGELQRCGEVEFRRAPTRGRDAWLWRMAPGVGTTPARDDWDQVEAS